jgi:biotin-dependent carboxylase-like uncharacterized protein
VIEVVEPGLLTSVQDETGRPAWRHLGVPAGGALDPWAARLANRLVGNRDDAALLECTILGPALRFEAPSRIALVGALDATVDSVPLGEGASRMLRAGSVVRIADGRDARAWLAVAGGIDVPIVLGGRGTDLRSGFGGWEGRALRAGDRIPIGAPPPSTNEASGRWGGAWPDGAIRVVVGPHASERALAALTAAVWRVAPQSDRTGVRLEASHAAGGEVPSMPLPLGAVQVPPDGRPIIMLADRPVTGGYEVPAVVIAADVGRVARSGPGDELSFRIVSRDAARRARAAIERELEQIG